MWQKIVMVFKFYNHMVNTWEILITSSWRNRTWPDSEKRSAPYKFSIDYDKKRIRSISLTSFEKKIQNWFSFKKFHLSYIDRLVISIKITKNTTFQKNSQFHQYSNISKNKLFYLKKTQVTINSDGWDFKNFVAGQNW